MGRCTAGHAFDRDLEPDRITPHQDPALAEARPNLEDDRHPAEHIPDYRQEMGGCQLRAQKKGQP